MSNDIAGYLMPKLQKLDYGISTFKERNLLVEDILNIEHLGGAEFADEFLLDLFEQTSKKGIDTSHLKAVLNQGDKLYSDEYVSKMLEVIGTYLLNSPDTKEEEPKDEKIKIYHSKELFLRAINEKNMVNDLLPMENDCGLDIFVKQKNFKKEKTLKLTPTIIENNSILKDYDRLLNYCKSVNYSLNGDKLLSKSELTKRRLARKNIGGIKKDMEYVLDCITKPIRFKEPLRDDGCPEWDCLDMMDEKVLSCLLTLNKTGDINNDLNCILLDLEVLIRDTVFTDKQEKVLKLHRSGYTMQEIADILNRTKQDINSCIKGCVKKLCKEYIDRYSDWYYLNIRYGDYKTCNRCGVTKLTENFYRKPNGYRGNCKSCS